MRNPVPAEPGVAMEGGMDQDFIGSRAEKALRDSVPDRWKGCASPIGAVQSYIAELERALEKRGADVEDDLPEDDPPEIDIHPANDGFVVAVNRWWFPGIYDTDAAARRAATEFDDASMQALQDRKNAEAGGAGGTITMADLDEVAAHANAVG